MIGMMVKIHTKSGEEEAVEKQMKKFASTCVSTEPGTFIYSIARDDAGRLVQAVSCRSGLGL